jgi:hypothetical protein
MNEVPDLAVSGPMVFDDLGCELALGQREELGCAAQSSFWFCCT